MVEIIFCNLECIKCLLYVKHIARPIHTMVNKTDKVATLSEFTV